MRPIALTLLLLSAPAAAWEASVQGEICVLTHEFDTAQVAVTHDPRSALPYAIQITRTDTAWTPAAIFTIHFEGPDPLTISTDRYELNADRSSVSVADIGFGNVLNGLEFNHIASAILGEQVLVIPLAGAAPKVARFRACTTRVET